MKVGMWETFHFCRAQRFIAKSATLTLKTFWQSGEIGVEYAYCRFRKN